MFSDIGWNGLALLCLFIVIFTLIRVFKPTRLNGSARPDNSQQLDDHWHASEISAVFEQFDSVESGLSSDQATKHF
ncbi:MAG: hypothetical protein JAZ19_06900, partial [Candidatus Thiodiazotropha taylori]|nr:hypothetical protein [Candidatus Thiodiazotropha taylori]MCG7934601.1 hypothetical protein [Candidatus Thiodiazotropha taylori]MCG7970217.1 hypothetical protein [Candidatus Thiodiazotropha taylori]MCG8036746.1 hypothetical protein [Candidatus Thiodiazotropha taylori]